MRPLDIVASLTGIALLLIAAPVRAQDAFETAQRIETGFADAETLRLRGDCAARARKMSDLAGYLVPFIAGTATGFSAAAKAEYRERLSEMTLRRCPAGPPPAPPAVVASPQTPPPRTVTLDDVRAEYVQACGRDWAPARERLIAALDRTIAMERDAGRRAAFESYRTRVQAERYRPCSKPPLDIPPASEEIVTLAGQLEGACGNAWSVLRLRLLAALDRAINEQPGRRAELMSARTALLGRDPPPCPPPAATNPIAGLERLRQRNAWQTAASEFDRDLLAAERARFRGQCAARSDLLARARAALTRMRASSYTPPTPGNHTARLAEQERLPCPPVTAAAPSRVPICESTYKRHREAGLPLTCRCTGVTRLLMTWGTEIYMRESTICNAAIHVGALPPNGVGTVRLIPVPRAGKPVGSRRNGITTNDYHMPIVDGFGVTPAGP